MKSSSDTRRRIMFVCLGNHCRSPLAHGYFQHLLNLHQMNDQIEVISSGTSGWHLGDPPDSRVCQVARNHGIPLDHLRGRKLTIHDLKICDLILVMDRNNLKDVLALDPEGRYADKVKLLRTFDPASAEDEIPDPYYSGIFEEVHTIVTRACDALLQKIKDRVS